MNKYIIAVGHSRMEKLWKNTEITWEELIERLKNTTRTAETQSEYLNMTKVQQDNIKDVGGFVGGEVINGRRKAENIKKRYILTLDADFANEDFIKSLDLIIGGAYCVYSTHKHKKDNARLRLIIPLSRPCKPEEYEAVARKVAEDVGIDMFDDTTYQAHRLMYWPSTSIDGDYIFEYENGEPLDVDETLNRYDDWRDVTLWPTSSRTAKIREKSIKKQKDPTAKDGIVGAFCRTYSIYDVIDKFLTDIYKPCSVKDRYTYSKGSSTAGLVVYENGKFAYSNHSTDPVNGILCNAFDLVRLHKFANEDENATEGTPTVKLPSYLAMEEFASKDKDVKILIQEEKYAEAGRDFEGLEDNTNNDWITSLECNSKGKYLPTIDNVKKILMNDPNLKNKFAFNEFTLKYRILGTLPWYKEREEKDWSDTDDAGLRYYLERLYGIKNKGAILDAWVLVATENKYHPVRDYLNGLKWDKEARLESLFIDYLGADDNEYTKAVTRKSLVAAVARIFEPGIKFDTATIFVGHQGCGKSYLIKLLSKNWGSDSFTTVQGKEAYEQIQGFWIIELAEMSAFKKADLETIKHFLTKQEDSFRAAYARHVETHKRQCIFFGTTNTYEFLKDQTGNRRFFPIDVHPQKKKKDMFIELTDKEVDQVWAEAVEIYKNGQEEIYMNTEKLKNLAKEEQERHLLENPMMGDIRAYLDKLLPDNWDSMELSERRAFYQGTDFGDISEGTVERKRVCAMEIWCELYGGEKKDLTIQRSKEIKECIIKTGEWEPTNSRFKYILYGSQRGFIKLSTHKTL